MLRATVISMVVIFACLGTHVQRVRAEGLGAAIDRAEHRLDRLQSHQGRLERRLAEQVQRVQRLKGQPKGVRRDYQLESTLRTSQQLASRLTTLRTKLRHLEESLLDAYDHALKVYTDPARLTRLEAKRKALMRRTAHNATPSSIVVKGRARPLDSAEDLEATADLLEDSADKVELELARVHRRIATLEARSQLQRHRRAAGGSLFIEESPRRLGRVMAAPRTTRAQDKAASPGEETAAPQAASPSPGASSVLASVPETPDTATPNTTNSAQEVVPESTHWTVGGDTGRSPTATPMAADDQAGAPGVPSYGQPQALPASPTIDQPAASLTFNLKTTLDPTTFSQLQRTLRRGDTRNRLSGYKTAAHELEALADQLSKQAKTLRRKAKKMRKRERAAVGK